MTQQLDFLDYELERQYYFQESEQPMANNSDFLFCIEFETVKQTNFIGGITMLTTLKGDYHLFRKDEFGQATISLCHKGRSDIATNTKIFSVLPRGHGICKECERVYKKTPLYQKWVKNAMQNR